MDLPQAIRYRPYKEWSSKDYQAITEKMAQSHGTANFMSNLRQDYSMTPMGFLISTVATIFLSKLALWGCAWSETMGTHDIHRPRPFYGNKEPPSARPRSR